MFTFTCVWLIIAVFFAFIEINNQMKYNKIHIWKGIIYITFFLLIHTEARAQLNIDSLRTEYENYIDINGQDTNAVKMLGRMFQLVRNDKPYLAIEIAAEALILAEAMNLKHLQASMFQNIAAIYYEQKVYYLAMDYFFKAFRLFEQLDAKNEMGICYINVGNLYAIQKVEEVAIDYYNKAAAIFLNENNFSGVALAEDRAGLVYLQLEQIEIAKQKLESALQHRIKSKLNKDIAESLYHLAKLNIQQEEYDKAKEQLKEALIRYKIEADKNRVAEIYLLYGDMHFENDEYDKASEFYDKALIISKETGNSENVTLLLNKFAHLMNEQGKQNDAIKFAQEAIDANNGFQEEYKNSYALLATLYKEKGLLAEAYESMEKLVATLNQITEDREKERITEMQVSLEMQRQEQEIEILRRDQDLKNEALKRSRIQNYSLLGGILFIALFGYYYFISSRKLNKSNHQLVLQNEEINKQKNEILKQKEELGQANLEIMMQKDEIQNQNRHITASITYASRIQNALLLDKNGLKGVIPDYFIFLKPKEVVSGDFYWYRHLKQENITIVTAIDCTGHGVPGAFMSMLADSFLDQIITYENITSADQILLSLHKLIRKALNQEHNDNRDGMDMALCVIKHNDSVIEFAGAKNPMFFFVDGEFDQFKGDNISIGGLQREQDRQFSKQILNYSNNKEIVLYLFTDGLQDQFGGPEKLKFSRKQIKDLLTSIQQVSMHNQLYEIDQALRKWQGKYEQLDDILFIGLKLYGKKNELIA